MTETMNTAGEIRFADRAIEAVPVVGGALLSSVLVILVSLPLYSPHDSLMNAGTIAAAAIFVSLPLAGAWVWLGGRSHRIILFASANVIAFFASAMVAAIVQQLADLERTVTFVIPLAAIYFGGTVLASVALERHRTVATVVVVVALVGVVTLGATLASHGDQPSGHLELPSR